MNAAAILVFEAYLDSFLDWIFDRGRKAEATCLSRIYAVLNERHNDQLDPFKYLERIMGVCNMVLESDEMIDFNFHLMISQRDSEKLLTLLRYSGRAIYEKIVSTLTRSEKRVRLRATAKDPVGSASLKNLIQFLREMRSSSMENLLSAINGFIFPFVADKIARHLVMFCMNLSNKQRRLICNIVAENCLKLAKNCDGHFVLRAVIANGGAKIRSIISRKILKDLALLPVDKHACQFIQKSMFSDTRILKNFALTLVSLSTEELTCMVDNLYSIDVI